MDGVIVIKRKLNRPKTAEAVIADSTKYADPSHESEKPKNPLEYRRASYAKAFRTKPLWPETRLTSRQVRALFGEPTRILSESIEWVVQIPSREIVKIVVSARGSVSVYGFNRTATLEKWVERMFNA
jgi:hypothetical protein